MSWAAVSRRIGRWRTKENVLSEHFFPHQDLFFDDTYAKPLRCFIAKIKLGKYVLVTEILSGAKMFSEARKPFETVQTVPMAR